MSIGDGMDPLFIALIGGVIIAIIVAILEWKDKELSNTEGDLHIKALIVQAKFYIDLAVQFPFLAPYADKLKAVIDDFETMWNDPKDRKEATEKLVATLDALLKEVIEVFSKNKA